MLNNTIFWITGLPGAGKTTFAHALLSALKPYNSGIVHLDGDELREVFKNNDYSEAGRKAIALQYSNLAKLLAEQQLTVIVSTVSLFHEIQDFNRNNFKNYVEILLDPGLDTLQKRNKKQLYTANHANSNVIIGQGIKAQIPQNPDFKFSNNNLNELQISIDLVMQQYVHIGND